MCTPSRRWMPEHSRHMSVPKVTDDQTGFFPAQSKQIYSKTESTQCRRQCAPRGVAREISRRWGGANYDAGRTVHTFSLCFSFIFLKKASLTAFGTSLSGFGTSIVISQNASAPRGEGERVNDRGKRGESSEKRAGQDRTSAARTCTATSLNKYQRLLLEYRQ